MNGRIPAREEMEQSLAARHGAELQAKLKEASVAICGLGGLGSNIAISLARVGVGRLHLIDFDRVDLSNLNRQQYAVRQIGQYKTEALQENLKAIAPYCEVVTDTMRIGPENLPTLFDRDQIICEAFDRPEAKAMLLDGVAEHFPDRYLVCGSGMAGLGSGNEIKTRQLTKRIYICGDESSDLQPGDGLFATRVMLCAAHQAHTVLRILAAEIASVSHC